jgi:hypothetical protein
VHKQKEWELFRSQTPCICKHPEINRGNHSQECSHYKPQPLQIAGGKHPTLSLLVPEIEEAWGPNVKYIVVSRNIESSVESIKKLGWGWPQKKKQIRSILQKIIDKRDEALENKDITSSLGLYLQYEEIIADPLREIKRICEFLNINPSNEVLNKAIDSINPKLQHHVI